MTPQLQESLAIVAEALHLMYLPADDVILIEQWQGLPGFSPARLKQLIGDRMKGGKRVTSTRYFDVAVRESFREWQPAKPRVRPLAERPWSEYLAHHTQVYGDLSAAEVTALHDRWRWERQAIGLQLEAPLTDEVTPDDPQLRARAAIGRPFPAAPGGA